MAGVNAASGPEPLKPRLASVLDRTPDVTFDATNVAFNVTHVTFWTRTVVTHSLVVVPEAMKHLVC